MSIHCNNSLLMSAKEVASLIGLSRSLFYSLHSEGRVPKPIKLGRRVMWRKKEIEAWVESGCPNRLQWESEKEN